MDRASAQFVSFDISSPEALAASVREFVERSVENLQRDLETIYLSSRRKASAMLRKHVPFIVKEAVITTGIIPPPSLNDAKGVVKSLFKKLLVERDVDSIAAFNSKPRGGRINLAGTITKIATNTTLQTQ